MNNEEEAGVKKIGKFMLSQGTILKEICQNLIEVQIMSYYQVQIMSYYQNDIPGLDVHFNYINWGEQS